MYTIKFKFEQPGLAPVTLTNAEPGYSLLEIAINNRIELHHACGGICSCSTCHLYLEKGERFVTEINTREKYLIARAFNTRLVSRLGCQCLLKEGRGKIEVTLPDQALEKFENETI
jgi:ferredoxin, 2Fe-2S